MQTDHIAGSAVTTAKIADAAVTPAKLSPTGAHQGDTIAFNGSAWQYATEVLRDEFVGGAVETNGTLHTAWTWLPSSTTTCFINPTEAAAGHPGVVRFRTATVAPGPVWMSVSRDDFAGGFDAGQIDMADVAWLRVICRVADVVGTTDELTSASYGIGLVTTASVAELNGATPNMGGTAVAFMKNAAQADWRMRHETAAVGVSTATGVTAVVGNWVEIFAINGGGGSWELFANGASVTTVAGLPTSGMVFPCVWIDDDDAQAADRKTLDVDLFEIGVLVSGNRFT